MGVNRRKANEMLKKNLVKYRLIEEHMKAVKAGKLLLGNEILYLLRKHKTAVGLDDVGNELEIIAEKCGCRITYSRNYNVAYIMF